MANIPLSVLAIFIFVIGACVGSFLSVCIERWPKEESILHPGSHCPHCKKKIPWYFNFPIIGWLSLRGKTACCKKRIPFRYFVSEIVLGLMAVILLLRFERLFLPYFILFCLLWVAFWTDLDTCLIPDEITLLGITLGILISYFFPVLQEQDETFAGMMESAKAVCLSMGGLFAFISFAEYFLKREAMGLGDVKLMGCIGAFLGIKACLFSLFLGSIFGTLVLFAYKYAMAIFFKKRIILRNKCIPFGPFLSAGALVYFFV